MSRYLCQKGIPSVDVFEKLEIGKVIKTSLHSGPTLGKMPDGPKIFEPLEEV